MDRMQKILKFIFILLIIVFAFSYFAKEKLPEKNIVPEMSHEPMQTETSRKSFSFFYRDTKYNVVPLANYEIWGMITTHNNINAWYNFYHDKNSVNIKDVCVIWGDNLSSKVYTAMTFKSGEWTCYPDWKYPLNRDLVEKFRSNKLSNNHLLSDKPAVLNTIKKMHIGDQIYLKGILASYGTDSTPERYYRGSSLTREDTGNGACEVMFVDEAKILKSSNSIWYLLFQISKIGIILVICLQIILFVIDIYLKPKKINYHN